MPNGLNLSEANPRRTLWESFVNSGYLLSKIFQASEFAGCRSTPSLLRSSLCHLIALEISEDINNLCNLGFNGKYLKTLAGIFLALFFHLEAPQILHSLTFLLANSFQNSMQLLGQA